MSVRFDEDVIVLNTRKDGVWDETEIKIPNNFKQGGRFKASQKEITYPHIFISLYLYHYIYIM